jgi:hypothetical protein
MEWIAPEFEFREKGVSWYWVSIILAAFMIAFAVWQKDFLFGFFVVVAEMLVIIWGDREPRIMPFFLSEHHLRIGDNKVHLLREFTSWSADRADEEWADLHFYFDSHWRAPLRMIVPHDRLEEFRANLTPVLKEVKHDLAFIDAIEKIIGF